MYCLGFKFGNVVYLSDVSAIPKFVHDVIKGCEVLILDAVEVSGWHPSHFTLEGSLEAIRKLCPKKTWLIGMTHQFHHEDMNSKLSRLKDEGIDVELSYDGLCIPIQI